MKKVVFSKPSSPIDIDELIDKLNNGSEQLIVFYRTSNAVDGVPCFLQRKSSMSETYHFKSPYVGVGGCFEGNNIRNSLAAAVASREVFVISKDEVTQLFKSYEGSSK